MALRTLREWPELVMISWEDSTQSDGQWRHLGTLALGGIVECTTVGFLLEDGKAFKAVAQSVAELGTDDAQASGIMKIPTRCIKKMKRL